MKPETIEVPIWWVTGNGMMYNRDCLPPDHPEHTYNWIKRELGLQPEDYGCYKNYSKFIDYGFEEF